MVVGQTAACALTHPIPLKEKQTVLITAAAGATGQMAVQWAKLQGCRVIGTCSTDEKCVFLKVCVSHRIIMPYFHIPAMHNVEFGM